MALLRPVLLRVRFKTATLAIAAFASNEVLVHGHAGVAIGGSVYDVIARAVLDRWGD